MTDSAGTTSGEGRDSPASAILDSDSSDPESSSNPPDTAEKSHTTLLSASDSAVPVAFDRKKAPFLASRVSFGHGADGAPDSDAESVRSTLSELSLTSHISLPASESVQSSDKSSTTSSSTAPLLDSRAPLDLFANHTPLAGSDTLDLPSTAVTNFANDRSKSTSALFDGHVASFGDAELAPAPFSSAASTSQAIPQKTSIAPEAEVPSREKKLNVASSSQSMPQSNELVDDDPDEDGTSLVNIDQEHDVELAHDAVADSTTVQVLEPVQKRELPFLFHFLMITTISLIGFGSYAAYDAVAAVQDAIMTDLDLSINQFGLLYSVYALPNVILVIFGGKMVDTWGAHSVGLITTVAIAVGAGLVALAPSLTLFSTSFRFFIMLLGRFLFGVGAESSYVVQNSMCVEWFIGDHLATAMAFTAIGTRMGTIISFLSAPYFSTSGERYIDFLWASFAACVISVVAVLGYMGLKSYAARNLVFPRFETENLVEEGDSDDLPVSSDTENVTTGQAVEMQSLEAVSLEQQLEGLEAHPAPVYRGFWQRFVGLAKSTWRQIRNFSSLYWACAGLGIFTYAVSLGFRAVASEAFATRYDMETDRANVYMAVPDITALIVAPFVGWMIDWSLKMGWITTAGNSLGVFAFILLLSPSHPLPGLVTLGLSATVVPAAIYPAISYLTSAAEEGLAFGIMSAMIAFGTLVYNPLLSLALDIGWNYMCLVLIAPSIFAVALSVWWSVTDRYKENPVLNRAKRWTTERWLWQRISAHIC